MLQNIIYQTDKQGIASITFNRPDIHNAFDENFIAELIYILAQIESEPTIKIVVIKANGKSFSAGADLKWMRKMASYSHQENYQDAMQLAQLMSLLYQLNKPTIAIVQGAAFGGGIGIIACCDIAIASENAVFCFSEVKLGLIPAVISPYVMNVMGQRAVQRYFLTAEKFDADEAKQCGLIHCVVSPEQLEKRCEVFCNMLLQNSAQAITEAKNLIHQVNRGHISQEMIDFTAKKIAELRVSEDAQKRLKSFLEKNI